MLARPRTVTLTLIGLNVLVFLVTAIQARSITSNQNSEIFFDFAMYGPLVDAGQWWRLIGASFLHYGPTHIAVNMISLYLLGNDVERFFGAWRFAVLYLVSGIGSALTVWWLTPHSLVAGASGAVFGLFGAAAVVLIRNKADLRPLLTVLALNVIISLVPGISLAAHAGGLVVGAILGFLFTMQRRAIR